MDNAADKKQIRRAQKAAKLAERNRAEVIVSLASTEPGRRYLWERIGEAGVFESVYNDNPQRMAFLAGRQDSGRALMDDFMRYAPDNFIVAMREANGRRTANDTIDRNSSRTPDAGELRGSQEPGWELEGGGAVSFGDAEDGGEEAGVH